MIVRRIRAWFATRTGRLVLHDGSLAAAAAVAYLETTSQPIDRGVLIAAGVIGLKAFLRLILPVPGNATAGPAEGSSGQMNDRTSGVRADRLALLPPPSGRKGGALPSPLDARDYKADLPTTIPARVDNGAGLTFGMLLNDRIGDCYPAALLHALQVLSGGKFSPTDADALHVYEQVTGYDPTRTAPDGSNPTDQGTYGRQLFDWARARGLITRYAAVPADRQSVRAAIAAHKAVLCEWALPVGAEREGDVWTMPRSGRAAGSWGGHATVEVGYTPAHNRNVTWGQEGTVSPAFEDAYLTAAWVVEVPATIPRIG